MKKLFSAIHVFIWKIKVVILETWRCYKYKDCLKESLSFQNAHDNARCFIIGNGPSLTIDDLERINKNNDITFAANRIFKMFPETSWRPTYYGVCDTTLFKKSEDDINKVESVKFLPLDLYEIAREKNKYHVFSRFPFTFFNRSPRFSGRINRRFGEGGTITYHLIQLAVSMGFKEIYLLGIDFSFSFGIGTDGKYFEDKTVTKDHFGADKSTIDVMPNLYLNLCAYKKAKAYADKHGIKIYNATRGGKLEVFERISIDSVLS